MTVVFNLGGATPRGSREHFKRVATDNTYFFIHVETWITAIPNVNVAINELTRGVKLIQYTSLHDHYNVECDFYSVWGVAGHGLIL